MEFNFQKVEKGQTSMPVMADDTLRVGTKSILISNNIGKTFTETRSSGSGDYQHVKLNIEYDPTAGAIRVTESPQGFSAKVYIHSRKAVLFGNPVNLRKAGALKGDYKLVGDSNNIFQYAGNA